MLGRYSDSEAVLTGLSMKIRGLTGMHEISRRLVSESAVAVPRALLAGNEGGSEALECTVGMMEMW